MEGQPLEEGERGQAGAKVLASGLECWTSYWSVVEDFHEILLRRIFCILFPFFLLSLVLLSNASLRRFRIK